MQRLYSTAARIIYNNLELTQDKEFINNIRTKYNIPSKLYEYLVTDMITWDKKWKKRKEKLQKRIEDIEKEMKTLPRKKRWKANKKLQHLKKSVNKQLCFGDSKKQQKLVKGDITKEEWRESRLWAMNFQGERSKYGSRFFSLDRLADGIVTFKLNRGTKFDLEFSVHNKKRRETLLCLQQLAKDKEIAISVSLSHDKICFSYDESILFDTNFDKREVNMQLKGLDKDIRKEEYKKLIRKHEERILDDKKMNRYLSMDLNPDGIGLVIADRLSEDPKGDMKILHKEYVDLQLLNKKLGVKSSDKRQKKQNNKRRYELTIGVKRIFDLVRHYKVSHIITEELNMEPGDKGSKESNRKINNLWCRTLLSSLFGRYVNEIGLKHIEINPAYSSFIGNIINKEYDPVAASIEICRRGMIKYIKGGSIYPEFCVNTAVNDLVARNLVPKKRYDELSSCETWKGLYTTFLTTKKSVRRELSSIDGFSGKWIGCEKSKVKAITFP